VSCDQNRLSTPLKVATNANALLRNRQHLPGKAGVPARATGMNEQGKAPQEAGKAIWFN
jgi:hypothetical protein